MTAASPESASPPPAPPLSIISLDDDADFREYIRHVLIAEGHAITTTETPHDLFAAIESTQQHGSGGGSGVGGVGGGGGGGGGGASGGRLPDIILLDIKMGHATGEEVLEELRRRWPKLCVIVVTGYPSLDSMRQTFKRDVFDYLAKPFSLDELRRTLAQAALTFSLGQPPLSPADRLRIELGRQIRLARAQKEWTLKDLSEASGISVSQLSSIERGSHLPSMESLLQIASALNHKCSDWLAQAGV